jgi:hypothetical protein
MARIDGLRRSHDGDISRWFMQAWTLYPLLQARGLMKSASVLSDEGGRTEINGVPITILSKGEARHRAIHSKNRFVHRVLARCDCNKDIPFGKLGQHRKACKVGE